MSVKVIKVSSSSSVSKLSGCIVKSISDSLDKNAKIDVELRAVGASAVNQMYKSIASARGILATKGLDIFICPGFDEIEDGSIKKTVMVAKIVTK